MTIGCWGEALSDGIAIDPTEFVEARWVSRPEVIVMLADEHPLGDKAPSPLSISHTLMRAFVEDRLTSMARLQIDHT
jgi:NAD+ diphosphatase